MPKYQTETFGPGDQSWIGPGSAWQAGRTEWMNTTDFATKAKNGVIPSGTALALVDGQLKPYNGAGGDDTGKLIGFLLTAQPANAGKIAVPVFDQGRVVVRLLPDKPFTVPAPEKDLTAIVYTQKD